MRDLLICVLALTWVLVVIRQMGTRRYPRETADHIDRDFRDLVDRAHYKATESGVQGSTSWSEWNKGDGGTAPAPDRSRERCPVHGWDCDNGAAEAKRREADRGQSPH